MLYQGSFVVLNRDFIFVPISLNCSSDEEIFVVIFLSLVRVMCSADGRNSLGTCILYCPVIGRTSRFCEIKHCCSFSVS